MKNIKGSEWRKWDLHFHTPSSYDYKNKFVEFNLFSVYFRKRRWG